LERANGERLMEDAEGDRLRVHRFHAHAAIGRARDCLAIAVPERMLTCGTCCDRSERVDRVGGWE